jgi:hypoxanthine phosphoribosyltransferase
MVVLARGGLTWSRDLADSLEIPEISSIRMKSYSDINTSSDEIEISQPLTDSIFKQNILLFDEVIDSGKTIKKALEYLNIMGAKDIQVAALCYKPRSIVKPDYHAFSTSAWVVFPHEIREFTRCCIDKWSAMNLSKEEIEARMINIGVPVEQVEFYSSL